MGNTSVNNVTAYSGSAASSTNKTSSNSLDIDDFYKLMAAQLQNQDVMNPADESDLMNQMMQIAVINAIDTFKDISTTSYAASLVGKDVTVAATNADGKTQEVYGTVTGTGLYSGEQIIFIDGKSYKLSSILAVGKLPDTISGTGDTSSTGGTSDTGGTNSTS